METSYEVLGENLHLKQCKGANRVYYYLNKNGLVVKTGYANRVNLMSHLTEQKDKSTQRGKQGNCLQKCQ